MKDELETRLEQARIQEGDGLAVLLYDPNPEVLASLLANPHLQEAHVRVLLHRADLPAAILEVIAREPRWIRSERVRLGLVQHPHAPRFDALTLLRQLFVFDLVRVCLHPAVPPEIRRVAEELLAERAAQLPTSGKLALAYGASPSQPNTGVNWSKYLPITGVPAFDRQNVPPYAETYTLSVERQLGKDTLLTMSYVGSQAHHLLVITPANPGNAALCVSVSELSQVAPGSPTCGPFSEGGLFTKADGEVVQVRGPFSSQFDAVTYQRTIGSSNYNSMEVNLRHHSKSLEILAGYTYSKSLDDSSSLSEEINPIDPGLSKALSAFDLRHNFVLSYNYSLPSHVFGRENRWTEGWSLSGVTRVATGLPVTFYNNNDTSLLGSIPNGINNNGLDTPDCASGNLHINNNPRNGLTAFNTSLFSLPALGQFGTAARRFFSGPGMLNFDVALQKNLRLTESKSLQFRMETFNTFNHGQFFGAASVDGNISDSTFGQVVNSMPPRLVQLAAKFVF